MDKRLYIRRDARIGVTLPQSLRDELTEVAVREEMTISAIVRIAVLEYLKKIQTRKNGNRP